jgi:iron(II)-dependent oxidoreductase
MGVTPDLVAALADARARTLALLEPIADADLHTAPVSIMSPLVWDLAHIGHYEELWLLRALTDAAPTDARFDDVYDAFRHPRAERPALDLLDPDAARCFLGDVRKRTLDVLADARPADDPLLADGFVVRMVVRHEHQHDETMLATLQLMEGLAHPDAGPATGAPGPDPASLPADVLVDAGPFLMGTTRDPWAYDNERPEHVVDLPAFRIDTVPVTNAAYAEFVADGGYRDARWWTEAGWRWRTEAALAHPQFWRARAGGWARTRFGRAEALPPWEPVQHVCWFEADAYARWRGRRLPTEAEWEKAASWDPGHGTGTKRSRPWGDAPATPDRAALAFAGRRFGPDAVGAHPGGASPWGCLDLLGGVWEWTATDFAGYPGFRAFPYREYSEVFFPGATDTPYKVLRGGSWATHPTAVSTTFRNWDLPIRRQIFAGFRCAADV